MSTDSTRNWKPLNSVQRRVVGVLVEKSKMTPDQYPLSLNALLTGANQKSNRDPQMTLNEDQVEQALSELREMGVVVEVQGSGRVPRYRHLMYEWLGVEKAELGVMAELLLRGPQTLGELRGHAARMETIPDLNALKPIVNTLVEKGLVIELTPEGRGQMVCHALYREKELPDIKARFASGNRPDRDEGNDAESPARPASVAPRGVTTDMFAELRVEVAELRAEVARLKTLVDELSAKSS